MEQARDNLEIVVDQHVLSRAVQTIERDFADQPLVRAAFQQTVTDTYREIGLYESSMLCSRQAKWRRDPQSDAPYDATRCRPSRFIAIDTPYMDVIAH